MLVFSMYVLFGRDLRHFVHLKSAVSGDQSYFVYFLSCCVLEIYAISCSCKVLCTRDLHHFVHLYVC